MNTFNKFLIFILAPFVYGTGFIKGSLTVYYNHFFNKNQIKFKPFWIETNGFFGPIVTEKQFEEICKSFKKEYPRIDILDIKISIHDYDPLADGVKVKDTLLSFGLLNEHQHAFDYTLNDWFNDV